MRDPSTASPAAQTPRNRGSGAPSLRRMTLVIWIAGERYTPTLRKEREGWGTRNTHRSRFVWRKARTVKRVSPAVRGIGDHTVTY